jgi:hypothetical protein
LAVSDEGRRRWTIVTTINVYWDHTPEITGRIIAYRNGDISFDTLLKELSERDYKPPSHYSKHGDVYEIAEEADRDEPGTWGEVQDARNRGLLTGPEYEAIASATLRAHGA